MANFKFHVGDIIKITNDKDPYEFPLNDAGSYTGPYAVPQGSTAYLSQAVSIPFYRSNLFVVLQPGETFEVQPVDAAESFHYQKVAKDLGIKVEILTGSP
jgi:hypothetical protein